ncbi:MAG: aspartate--tRNA ligase [Flavobacteriaceae bacterium]|nr:aspartate--tRNA ligase [Flavobacteriaceae bacterium]
MFRSHSCGEIRLDHVGQTVTLAGWVQRRRDLGGMSFIDLRDRYGITQLSFNELLDPERLAQARKLNREFVIQARGTVVERENKNPNMATGDIELRVHELVLLNASATPPFTIEDETDGGEELRMKYRYLDIRRAPVRQNLLLRHRINRSVRSYLDNLGFVDVETPFLIKSTPEGARDFVVPSRLNQNQFYALPQSPQTFKQLLMVAGMDRYYQIVRCFRDEDLRADRQPEFTQIDCEMAFVEQEDILNTFEGLLRHVLREVHGVKLAEVPRMTYDEAMRRYGNDKPDIRFGMEFIELTDRVKGKGFPVFDQAELVVGLNAKGCGTYSRKQLDALTDFVKRPQLGMTGLIWMRLDEQGLPSSSVTKFFDESALKNWAEAFGAEPGDLVLVLAGGAHKTRKALSELRLHLGQELGLRKPFEFAPLWVVDFPLLEWDEDSGRWFAMHHPFTSPKPEDIALLETNPGAVRANAYDIVLNGNEIGGGSIRIHDRSLQARMLELLGFSPEEAQAQFGFLMNAFEYGAPPHGGIAFGFDRLVALMGGDEVIRDYIAFPKNNSGRDVMIDAPAAIAEAQMQELNLLLRPLKRV